MPIGEDHSHPNLLCMGTTVEDEINLPTDAFDIDRFYPNYLKVRILYEDTERNLYAMNQTYYLSSYQIGD